MTAISDAQALSASHEEFVAAIDAMGEWTVGSKIPEIVYKGNTVVNGYCGMRLLELRQRAGTLPTRVGHFLLLNHVPVIRLESTLGPVSNVSVPSDPQALIGLDDFVVPVEEEVEDELCVGPHHRLSEGIVTSYTVEEEGDSILSTSFSQFTTWSGMTHE